ncbi:MAG: zinc-dependent metalloprotease, partial [Limisphaerales bacterium]
KAFRKVGIDDAIVIEYQDAVSGAHMEKDPEDVRYNFIRWLNNNVGTAIGPSRANPMTGEILDADIILTDGWIRHFWRKFNQELPKLAMEGYSPETLSWLQQNPQWDPRVRLAHPSNRAFMAKTIAAGYHSYGGHPVAHNDASLIGDQEFDGLIGRTSQVNGFCQAADFRALDMAVMRFALDLMGNHHEGEEDGNDGEEHAEKEEEKAEEDMLDGIPDWFVGPLIADLVAHEVGHTIGLRHNFKASSIYDFKAINSDEIKGKKPFAGSVMDYLPVNMNLEGFGEEQGDYGMIEVGPYDLWAIEYGYSIVKKDDELKSILARVNDPLLAYATDEDTYGPDPFARRYDFGKDPINYAKSQIKLANDHRAKILDEFVKDGESWAKARYGYGLTLSLQMRSLSMMANWLGGALINRSKKGDPDAGPPIEVVSANR